MKRVAIITSSDTGYRGEREDLSGPAIKEIVEHEGYEVVSMDILPDDQVMLAGKMQEIADKEMCSEFRNPECRETEEKLRQTKNILCFEAMLWKFQQIFFRKQVLQKSFL